MSALAYLQSFTDWERRRGHLYDLGTFKLERVVHLMAALDHPEATFPSIHVAGSKGKGSTAAICESLLRAAGCATGLYTSPHLHDYRERIRLNGLPIEREMVVSLLPALQAAVAQVHEHYPDAPVTTFDVGTALAFLAFREARVDVAVIEVGIGGRLDSTNVITPLVSVITPISLEHQNVLGNTIAEIAWEKAGIIKPGVPVVAAPQRQPEASAVIARRAAELGCRLTTVAPARPRNASSGSETGNNPGRQWRVEYEGDGLQGQRLWLSGFGLDVKGMRLPLLGSHQAENAATAVAAVLEAGVSPLALMKSLGSGLARVAWPGRLEVIGQAPLTMVDGAHNGESMERLLDGLREHTRWRGLLMVVGVSLDKNIDEMIHVLAPTLSALIAVQSEHPRAMPATELAERARALAPSLDVRVGATVAEGLALARRMAGADDVIVATGSLFVVAEARAQP